MSHMTVNGLHAELNAPPARTGSKQYGLPPHLQVPAFVVDENPGCPANWMHGSSKASSYFAGVDDGCGLWFDFTMNSHHSHHVAVVVSVQGVNPVTNQPITELKLVQHKEKCPKCDVDFQQDRFCPTCEYKWPAQNYIATTTGQTLWIDGFRINEIEIRQYIVTAEKLRGIAEQTIGEDRVWAIGFAFYLSKAEKPRPAMVTRGGNLGSHQWESKAAAEGYFGGGPSGQSTNVNHYYSSNQTMKQGLQGEEVTCSTSPMGSLNNDSALGFCETSREIETEKLEVGAGSVIGQNMGVDPNPIDFWQPEPAGMIYLNYVSKADCAKILEAGARKEKKDGPLTGLKVGN